MLTQASETAIYNHEYEITMIRLAFLIKSCETERENCFDPNTKTYSRTRMQITKAMVDKDPMLTPKLKEQLLELLHILWVSPVKAESLNWAIKVGRS